MSFFAFVAKVIFTLLFAFCLLLFIVFAHSRFVYFPSVQTGSYDVWPKNYNVECSNVTLKTADGVSLHGWWIEKGRNNPSLIYCHGNAGNVGDRVLTTVNLANFFNYNVLMFDYRGFGLSQGVPSHDGLRLDCEAAVNYAIQKKSQGVGTKLMIYGHSIGGGVALDYVAKHRGIIDCFIVENTFLSLRHAVAAFVPRVRYLVPIFIPNVWTSEVFVPSLDDVDAVFVYGENDTLIPTTHTLDLHRKCGSRRKVLVRVAGADHNNTFLTGKAQIVAAVHDLVH